MLKWPKSTLYQEVAFVAADAPSRPILVFEDETTTHGDLFAESRRLARALAALGVGAGEAIAVWLRNHTRSRLRHSSRPQ